MVVGKKIKLLNIPKNDVIKILEKEKLYKIPNEPIFDYLIKIPFYSFTKEKIDELEKIIYEKNKLHKLIKNKKITDLWLDDLNELLKYLS